MCLYPKIIRNRKYCVNKKNGGNIPPVKDERVKYVAVGCSKCMECRKQKARGWQVRLLEDIKTNKNGKFITLTFSNENYRKLATEVQEKTKLDGYELDNEIATLAMRRFLERWRKKYKKSLRHWTVTELGHEGTEHLHLHGIIWTDEPLQQVEKIWHYGFMWKGKPNKLGKITNYVNGSTINYMIKYVNKADEKHKEYRSIILTSPGIGKNYTNTANARSNKFKPKITDETYRTSTGHKIALPVYWRNKIYTEEQREQLWLEKLDKEERWVCGERVSIKQHDNTYYKLLEWYRKLNKQLGYGDDRINWTRRQYERERRNLKQQERIRDERLRREV